MPSEISSFRRQSFFTVTASATFKYKHSFSAAGSSKSALYTAIRIPPGTSRLPGRRMRLLRPRVHRKQRLQHLRRHRRFPHRDLRRFQRHRRNRRIAGQQNAKRPHQHHRTPKNDAGRGRRAFPHPSFSWQHISHCVFYLLDGIRPEKSIQYGAVEKVSQQPSRNAIMRKTT